MTTTGPSRHWRFVWWPIVAAAVLATACAALEAFLGFVPNGDPQLGGLRNMLSAIELLGVFGWAMFWGYGLAIFAVVLLVLLVRRAWWTLAAVVLALPTFAATLHVASHVWLFDPYYWYVVVERDRLLMQATPSGRDGTQIVGRSRDVSTGLGVMPTKVATIVYDLSDALADPSRDPQWKAMKREVFGDSLAWIDNVRRLRGHYYLVLGSWG